MMCGLCRMQFNTGANSYHKVITHSKPSYDSFKLKCRSWYHQTYSEGSLSKASQGQNYASVSSELYLLSDAQVIMASAISFCIMSDAQLSLLTSHWKTDWYSGFTLKPSNGSGLSEGVDTLISLYFYESNENVTVCALPACLEQP